MSKLPDWNEVAISNWYRRATSQEKQKLKAAWLKEVAPIKYPGFQQSQEITRRVYMDVLNSKDIPIIPGEQNIITDDTLDVNGFTNVEANPEYARRPFEEQQALKDLWFRKLSVFDEEFKELEPDEKEAYYKRLMYRSPEYSGALNFLTGSDTNTGLVSAMDIDNKDAIDWEKFRTGMTKANSNVISSFLSSFGSLVLGPARWIAGEDSGIANALKDVQKEREWLNYIGKDVAPFVTETVPNVAGYLTGIATGPFMGLEKLFAGTDIAFKAGQGFTTGAGGIIPGIVGKVAPSVPKVVSQTAGGALAGVIQGVAESAAQNKPWHTYLPQDISIGIAAEFFGRYFGAVRQLRRLAKNTGTSKKGIVRGALDIGSGKRLSGEIVDIAKANPNIRELATFVRASDKNGMLQKLSNSDKGIEIKADVIGLKADTSGDNIRLYKNNDLIYEFDGPRNEQIRNANDYLDVQDGWEKYTSTLEGKSVQEIIETSPVIRARTGLYVPQAARDEIASTLRKHNINYGIDARIDPRGDNEFLDRAYSIIKSKSVNKAESFFDSLGIRFSDDPASNKQVITNMKSKINEMIPDTAYFVTDTTTGSRVTPDEIPLVHFESPDLQQPFMHQQVFAGTADDIREILDKYRKSYANKSRATTRVANARNMELDRMLDTETLEMKIDVPDGTGNVHNVILHFPNLKTAQEALTTGKYKGLPDVAKKLFNDDPQLQKSYNSFIKAFKKSDPQRFKKDFLPFKFVSAQAKQNDMYLGVVNGKYIIQDVLTNTDDISVRQFDNLNEALDHIRSFDRRQMKQDLVNEVSQTASEVGNPAGIQDPMFQMPYEKIKASRKFTIRDYLPLHIAPEQYVVNRFENMTDIQRLRSKYGFSPVDAFNDLRDSNRLMSSWENQRMDHIDKLKKGIKKEEGEYLWRYMQAIVTPDEVPTVSKISREIGLKSDVRKEMIEKFGPARTDELIEQSAELNKYFNELFTFTGMDWNRFEKHYLPHISDEIGKMNINMSSRIDPKRFAQIPDADRTMFFELLREVDPRDVLWETDPFKLAETYTRLIGRSMFMRPTMKKIGDTVRKFTKAMRDSGAQSEDVNIMVNYIGRIFEDIDGIHAPSQKIFRYATARSLDNIIEAVNARLGTKFKPKSGVDLTSKVITLATGGQLAARPFPVLRNLTQSLVTGGSLIGDSWWLEGVHRLGPDSLARMENLGIFKKGYMPVGTGQKMSSGALGTMVSKAMTPFKAADKINRTIVYLGTEARVQSAIDLYTAGKISQKRFKRLSGMTLFGKAEYNSMAKLLNKARNTDEGLKALKDRISRIAVDRSQYLYDSWNQPIAFKSTIGRFFGQYTSWPINFYNLVKERMFSDSLTIPQKIGFLSRLSVNTGAIAVGLHEAGISPNGFYPWNMMTFSGGPYYSMINDLLEGLNGSQDSYNSFVRTFTSIVPFVYEGEGVLKAMKAFQDGDGYEALLHLISAPIRYDIYPRRKVFTDDLEKALQNAGKGIIGFKRSNILEGVD
jgi:hypothetical protein